MMSGSDSALKLRIQGAVLVVLVFLAGVLAGGAGERLRASRPRHGPPGPQMGEIPRPFARLGLTEEQQNEISAVFESARPRTDSVLQEFMPRLQAINDSIHAEIRAILSPEQAAMLDEDFERRGLGPGGRMGGPWRRPFLSDSPPGGGGMPRPPDAPPDSRRRPPPPER